VIIHKVLSIESLVEKRNHWQAAGDVVVWTNGCFDLFHVGHLRSLQAAKSLGDRLIVGINSDASIRRLKGPGRPIIRQEERCEIIAALECVDAVLLFEEDTPEVSLRKLRPDIHCKGADYAPPNGKPIPERELVEDYGGRVAFIPIVSGFSTSSLIETIQGIQ
jgi:rfaE bifunctional protein nucleotidyltransferase chain/domain